jgi:hypothetical protein
MEKWSTPTKEQEQILALMAQVTSQLCNAPSPMKDKPALIVVHKKEGSKAKEEREKTRA